MFKPSRFSGTELAAAAVLYSARTPRTNIELLKVTPSFIQGKFPSLAAQSSPPIILG